MATNLEIYMALCHAMQSGVAAKMNFEPAETQPKSLRVGVNSALVSNGALVSLLIAKGLITQEEFEVELNEFMQREVDHYQADIRKHYSNDNINLG